MTSAGTALAGALVAAHFGPILAIQTMILDRACIGSILKGF